MTALLSYDKVAEILTANFKAQFLNTDFVHFYVD